MPSKKLRHTCQKCGVKRTEDKMFSCGRSLMNGKRKWYSDLITCKFSDVLKKVSPASGAEDTLSMFGEQLTIL